MLLVVVLVVLMVVLLVLLVLVLLLLVLLLLLLLLVLTRTYVQGFDAVKLDNCGKMKNMARYAEDMIATGQNYTIEVRTMLLLLMSLLALTRTCNRTATGATAGRRTAIRTPQAAL